MLCEVEDVQTFAELTGGRLERPNDTAVAADCGRGRLLPSKNHGLI
jgi:hypothetical protein